MASCPVCQRQFDNATFCPRDGSRLEVAAETGALLGGRYRLIRKVGEGAMGVVFEAEHVSIRRRVAVKILQRTLVASAEMVERLRREAQVTSGLGHPNIVECLDFGSEGGQVYLVMEWLDGENLDERLGREVLAIDTLLDIAAQTCAGLAEAHDHGIIHRDLKPANLFLTRDRAGALRVKILDFGIAKLAAEQTQLTSTGVVIGTPNYMAPEQALGERVDARADVYALGVILYELVAGRVPFLGDTPLAVLHQHTTKMPVLPSATSPRAVPRALDDVVMRCLAKAPGNRYQTMPELGAAIEHVRGGTGEVDIRQPPPMGVVVPTAAPPAPTHRNDGDDIDDAGDAAAILPRRRRWLAIALASVTSAGLAFAGIALLLGRDAPRRAQRPLADALVTFVPSSLVDAALADGAVEAPPVADGATPDVAAEATLVNRTRAARFSTETRMTTVRARHAEPVTFVIVLSDLDVAGREALAAGQLQLAVRIEHFAKHDLVAADVLGVDAAGRATLAWTPRKGRHHVSLEPRTDSISLGKIRFDIVAE